MLKALILMVGLMLTSAGMAKHYTVVADPHSGTVEVILHKNDTLTILFPATKSKLCWSCDTVSNKPDLNWTLNLTNASNIKEDDGLQWVLKLIHGHPSEFMNLKNPNVEGSLSYVYKQGSVDRRPLWCSVADPSACE